MTAVTPVPSTSPQSAMSGNLLAGRSLVVSYGKTPALRGATVTLDPGEILAITGASGSGKSTLLLCLAGILPPDAGDVTYAGRVISDASEAARARLRRTAFGVLFQFGQLVPELTAEENVALPLLLEGVNRSGAMSAARTWLERFGVVDLAPKRPPQMSVGQAQRVALARAMVTEPKVLFADEPTGALDALAGEQVMGQIVRVARDAGTSVLLVTHEATVAAYGDREILMRDGMIVGGSQ